MSNLNNNGFRGSQLRMIIAAVVAVLVVLVLLLQFCAGGAAFDSSTPNESNTDAEKSSPATDLPADAAGNDATDDNAENRETSTSTEAQDAIIAELFEQERSDVQVEGGGVVARLLADDTVDGRHQRFILELASGQTLLVAHNIDVAPRLDGLEVGDEVRFYGEYYYSEEGGGIHWTHRDASGDHKDGWLRWNGKEYS